MSVVNAMVVPTGQQKVNSYSLSGELTKTRKCKSCGRTLPISEYRITRWGTPGNTCKTCVNSARKENRENKRKALETPYYDKEFDGKQPIEVIQLMSRAKRWLEDRGYEITLRGSYTKKVDVKF